MLLTFPLLTADEIARARQLLQAGRWVDGRTTAGEQAVRAKQNQQLDPACDSARALQDLVTGALERTPRFLAAALPKRIVPPQFNRYTPEADRYGPHVDNAVRVLGGTVRVRTDLSCTVFLAEPSEYDGGELVVAEPGTLREVKLPAGHAVLYPGTSVHEVRPVTRGARLASFLWIESMVRGDEQRRLLLELDDALMALRRDVGDNPSTVALMATYHNLLRMWAET
jgi:PKHD-type hydroxylase